jgi:phosphoribosyl-ATP pyrophosphohydrolase/phosphoribosyl-AMP cyclohydrolase
MSNTLQLDALVFNDRGLIPAIAQDSGSGKVLMLAWMSRESLQKTLEVGEAVYFSRSRNELWHKGATSGNRQIVESISYDCDADSLLLKVKPAGPACHTGDNSCFDAGFLVQVKSFAPCPQKSCCAWRAPSKPWATSWSISAPKP